MPGRKRDISLPKRLCLLAGTPAEKTRRFRRILVALGKQRRETLRREKFRLRVETQLEVYELISVPRLDKARYRYR